MSVGSVPGHNTRTIVNGESRAHRRNRLWAHRIDRRHHCVVLRVQGELDAAVYPEFDELLERAMRAPSYAVVLDLRETTFMSVRTAIALGAARDHALFHGGDLRIVAGHRRVERALEVTGVRSRFRRYDSMRAALDA